MGLFHNRETALIACGILVLALDSRVRGNDGGGWVSPSEITPWLEIGAAEDSEGAQEGDEHPGEEGEE